jgi:hypothetical protein
MDVETIGTIAIPTALLTLAAAKLLGGGSWKLSGRITSIEGSVNTVKTIMQSMQSEITRMGNILEKIADLKGDIRVLENRVDRAEEDIRELQHGEGMVLPIHKSAYEKP